MNKETVSEEQVLFNKLNYVTFTYNYFPIFYYNLLSITNF